MLQSLNDFLLKSILTARIPTDIIRNEFGDDLYHKFIRYKMRKMVFYK